MSEQGEAATRRPKVLIADDVEFHRTVICDALEGLPVEIIFADDGWNAIDVAREQVPDLALLDIVMPEINGPEVARTLRESPELSHCEFVLLSANVTDEHAFDPIFAAVVEKPIDADNLRATVARLLGIEA